LQRRYAPKGIDVFAGDGQEFAMKLNMVQWLWMIAAAVVMASALLDLADVVNVPPIYWLLGTTSLTVSAGG
jgi:hypothetical protein